MVDASIAVMVDVAARTVEDPRCLVDEDCGVWLSFRVLQCPGISRVVVLVGDFGYGPAEDGDLWALVVILRHCILGVATCWAVWCGELAFLVPFVFCSSFLYRNDVMVKAPPVVSLFWGEILFHFLDLAVC